MSITWGVLGTANIAAVGFLPALRAAGATAAIVGSRRPEQASRWATENQVGAVGTYQDVVNADHVQAVYVALPNDMHVYWASRLLAAGKAVLCEKPLGLDPAQVRSLLDAAGEDALLWEAFVFPFHPQTSLIADLVNNGDIGQPREIVSDFHFWVRNDSNIRLQRARGGGALYDVGCYPIRLARLLTRTEPVSAVGAAHYGGGDVDVDMIAAMHLPGEVTLVLSAGLRRPPSTYTRIIGTDAELRVTNPFHPRPSDSVELLSDGEPRKTWPAAGETSAFEHAVAHINQVVAGEQRPRYRAVDDSLNQAESLELVRTAIGSRSR